MTTAIVKMYSTTQSGLERLPVVDGQMIFVQDTKNIYLDFNSMRICYTAISVFKKDSDRQDLLAPVEGFYFVEETSILWRYKKKWIQISPDNLNPVFFGKRNEFPSIGRENVLYTSDNAIYKWDTLIKDYVIISNKTEWTVLE